MYLVKLYKKTGRTYLSIVHNYRDKNSKTTRGVVKAIGYSMNFQKEYDDPIAFH